MSDPRSKFGPCHCDVSSCCYQDPATPQCKQYWQARITHPPFGQKRPLPPPPGPKPESLLPTGRPNIFVDQDGRLHNKQPLPPAKPMEINGLPLKP